MALSLRLAGEWDASQSPIPDACVCTALRMLTRFVTRPMERMLAGSGLGLTEFQIMVVLVQAPTSALGLTRRLRLDPAPVSRALARLRERGIVTRASTGRLTCWSLTDAGRTEMEVLDLAWPGMNARSRETLGGEFANRVIALVDQLPKTLRPERPGWSDD